MKRTRVHECSFKSRQSNELFAVSACTSSVSTYDSVKFQQRLSPKGRIACAAEFRRQVVRATAVCREFVRL